MAADHDIEIYQGDDYALRIEIRDGAGAAIDLSARTYQAQIRETRSPDAELLAEFAIDMTEAPAGDVVISLTDTQTAAMTRSGAWDFQQVDAAGKVRTLLAGDVALRRQVTV